MHKDKPPGLFEFAHRSVGHAIRLGLLTGFVIAALAHIGLILSRANSSASRGVERLESDIATQDPKSNQTPAPASAIRR